MSEPNGKTSDNEYTYDKSLETDITLMVSVPYWIYTSIKSIYILCAIS